MTRRPGFDCPSGPDDRPIARTHYADEDRDLQPICGGGEAGDKMTFFGEQTTCPSCLNLIEAVLPLNPTKEP